jgi:hypothetical protein
LDAVQAPARSMSIWWCMVVYGGVHATAYQVKNDLLSLRKQEFNGKIQIPAHEF